MMQSTADGSMPGRAAGLLRRLGREIAGGQRRLQDVALANAGALDDPAVRRVDHLRQVFVGQLLGRHRAPGADDAAAGSRHASREPLGRRPSQSELVARDRGGQLRAAGRSAANRSATNTAFLIAIAFEPPWQISATPSTPSSGAPPCSRVVGAPAQLLSARGHQRRAELRQQPGARHLLANHVEDHLRGAFRRS